MVKKQYKITLKEFFDSKEKMCIHCDTEKKANALIDAIGKVNKEYYFGLIDDIAIYGNRWNKYTYTTVYDNRGNFGGVASAKKLKYTIYEFEDVDLGE